MRERAALQISSDEEFEYVRADVEFEIEYSRCVDEAEDDET